MNEITQNQVGRPAVNLDEAFTKIQPYLQLGYTFHKACLYAQVPYSTLIVYYTDDKDFQNKVERERGIVSLTARRNLVNAIRGQDEIKDKDGRLLQPKVPPDIQVSKEWLETQEKDDWSKRTEVRDVTNEGNEGIILLREIITERRQIAKEKRTKLPPPKDE